MTKPMRGALREWSQSLRAPMADDMRRGLQDDIIAWFLYCSAGLVVLIGADVVYLHGKMADYLAYALPCLAGLCVGGNLIRHTAERLIWVISVFLLIGGFNAFLTTLDDSEFYFAFEFALLLSLLIFTFCHLYESRSRARQGARKRAFFISSVALCMLILGYVGTLEYRKHKNDLAIEANVIRMHAHRSADQPRNEPDGRRPDGHSSKKQQ